MTVCRACVAAHPLHGRLEGARKDEAVDALLQPRDGHDLRKVALHCPKQPRIANTPVLGVLPLPARGAL